MQLEGSRFQDIHRGKYRGSDFSVAGTVAVGSAEPMGEIPVDQLLELSDIVRKETRQFGA